jgi:hypothetical protein
LADPHPRHQRGWTTHLAAGLTHRQAAHRVPHWTVLHRGVFLMPGAPLTPRAMIRAACVAGAPHAAASHRSGAALFELPGGRQDLAEVTCPRWLRTAHSDLIVHESKRIDPEDVRMIDGIPVMRPERVLIELASIYRSPNFIELVLHAVLRKKLGTIGSTVTVFNRLAKRGRPGIAVVRAVLERWDPSLSATPETPPETTLFQILRDAGLGRVVPQHVVRDVNGRFVARVDIGLPDLRVTVEYDSDQEHTNEITIANDNERRNDVIKAGWFPVVARPRDLRNSCVHLIAAIRALRSQPA